MTKFINEPFDEEERKLMEAVETGQTKSVSPEELERIKASAAKMVSEARNVTIRIQNADVSGFKERARMAGMPYQTLINSVLHRYLTGELVPKTPI